MIKTALKAIKSFLSLFVRTKPKAVYGITSDSSVKLPALPVEKPVPGTYCKLERYDDCFEVTHFHVKQDMVSITDIAGREIIMSVDVFHYFFYEIARFTPKKYVPINKTNKT